MEFDDLVAAADRVVLDVFGVKTPVVYTPEDGEPVSETPAGAPLIGVFSELYELAKSTADAGVGTVGPAVFFRLSDLPDSLEEDDPTITIRGDDYEVAAYEPDGAGGIVLRLRKVS